MLRRGALRRDGDRGLVLPLVGIVLTVLIAFTSLALDLGYERVRRRDMQAVADVTALDLVRLLDGSTAQQILPVLEAAAPASAARNNHGSPTIPCPTGTITGHCLTIEVGTVDPTTRVFTLINSNCNSGPNCVPNGVRVAAGTDVDYFFRPGSGDTRRTAVAGADAQACFKLGSFALGLNSGNSALLDALIGDALGVGVLGYNGLATSSFTLLGLGTQLNAGTVDEVLNTEMSLGEFYLAVAQVMANNGDTANATLLQSIALNGNLTPGDFRVGDLLSVSPDTGAALGSTFNVLDVVAGSAFVANGTNAIGIPALTLNLLGLTNLTSSLSVIESPRRACGRAGQANAANSQLTLATGGTLAAVSVPIVGLGNVSVTAGTVANPVQISLSGGNATGTLASILCGDATLASPDGIDVTVVTALLAAGIDVPLRITGTVNLLGLGNVTVTITLTARAATSQPATGSTAEFRIPPDAYDVMEETGTGTVGLSGLAVQQLATSVTATISVLGLPVAVSLTAGQIQSIVGPVINGVVNPLITQVDAALLGPLSQLFGLNVAGADVAATLPEIDCQAASLLG